jgi:putative ribosome biogenesis GTPase RsgA
VIDKIEERKTLLYRSDQYKSKLLAANLTQLFIVVATDPASPTTWCRARWWRRKRPASRPT